MSNKQTLILVAVCALILVLIYGVVKLNIGIKDPETYQECNVTSLSNPNITWENVVIVGGYYNNSSYIVFVTLDQKRIYLYGPHFTERKVIPTKQ